MSASTPTPPASAPAPVTNWAGNVTFAAARIHRPESVDELRRAVAAADSIRALGTGHSFSRIADTTGDLVRLDALPPEIEIDCTRPDAPTVTFTAGTSSATLADPSPVTEAGVRSAAATRRPPTTSTR